MTTIYRIQDIDGRGPWKPGFSHKWVESRDDHYNLTPWHEQFGTGFAANLDRSKYLGCGCLTIQQMRRWFTPKEYAMLQKHGYEAVKMEVERILAKSEIQCVFESNKPMNTHGEVFDLYDRIEA